MSNNAQGPSGPHDFFAYIGGLRAVAVVSVVLFHMKGAWLPGGYAGVDVFFVISGFIVSGSLHRYQLGGFWDFLKFFYARRFRRIIPALAFMLALATLLSLLFTPDTFMSSDIRNVALASALGYSNFLLARGPDYFSTLAEFNPFTHTWSLSVEEQFYVIFPALFFLMRTRMKPLWALLALLLLCALSFVSAFDLSTGKATASFYSSLARFWQIGAGVALYKYLAAKGAYEARQPPLPEIAWASWLGATIMAASFIWSQPTQFPAPGGLAPVGGALLVIWGLHGRTPTTAVGKLLSSGPAVWVGAISYSLYLWHWPIFVLARWTFGFSFFSEKVAALALALAMAIFSYYFVETPYRNARRLARPLVAIVVSVALILGVRQLIRIGYDKFNLISLSTVTAHRGDWYPGPEPAPVDAQGCAIMRELRVIGETSVHGATRANCPSPKNEQRLYVIGDSHALSYSTMFEEYTLKTGVANTRYLLKFGCSFLRITRQLEACKQSVEAAMTELEQKLRPGDILFMPALRVERLKSVWSDEAASDAQLPKMREEEGAMEEGRAYLARLEKTGATLVFEPPKPIFKAPMFRCADWFNRNNPTCRGAGQISRATMEAYRAPVVAMAERWRGATANFQIFDPMTFLCDDKTCDAWRDGKPLFFDSDHTSAYGDRFILPYFAAEMARLGLPALP
jgi:peptidoglycan/LPS O-acetylase OafA/YrhL